MSLKTRIAVWENNGAQLRGLDRYAQEREEIRKTLPGKPGSAMPEYMPYTHAEYLAEATPETVSADFRSGSWRIARRTGAAVLAAAVAYGIYTDRDTSSESMAPPAVAHEVGQPTGMPETSNQQDLVTSITPVNLAQ